MKRVLTAAVLAVFALWTIFLSPQLAFLAITAIVACLCYSEFLNIARAHGVEGPLLLVYPAGLAAMVRVDALPILTLILLIAALRVSHLRNALGFAGSSVLAIVYVFLPWRWAADLRAIHTGWLFYALSVNWVGDAAAYYAGRAFGRNKLAPRVSPGKSWEGAVGSVIVSTAYGIALGQWFHLDVAWPVMAGLTVVANAAGQIGDLVESALKRGAGLKDSGSILPGHGGLLDRLDSSLFTLPVVYHFVRWVLLRS